MMKKINESTKEIPQRAFINAQIIQEVLGSNDWISAKNSICNKYKLENYQYQNQSYIVSLLYCLILVPKEVWINKDKENEVFKKIDEKKISSLFEITCDIKSCCSKNFSYNLIHKLRNSLAHANFSFDSDLKFIFWDKYDNILNFEAEISSEKLFEFINIIGVLLANLRSKGNE